jgi:chaperone required for assembly of F1-ATPase
MTGPGPAAQQKRFFKEAAIVQSRNGWVVTLDGKPVQTPAKQLLAVPTRALASRIAAEWNAQGANISVEAMPVFRLANTAIDQALNQKPRLAAEIVRIGHDDLLSHRTAQPKDLAEKEAKAWDPYLRFAEKTFGLHIQVGVGHYHIEQDFESFYRLEDRLKATGPFLLTGIHGIATLTHSAVLALAVAEGFRSVTDAWEAAIVDEAHPSNPLSQKPETAAALKNKEKLFTAAAAFLRSLQRKLSEEPKKA